MYAMYQLPMMYQFCNTRIHALVQTPTHHWSGSLGWNPSSLLLRQAGITFPHWQFPFASEADVPRKLLHGNELRGAFYHRWS